MPLPPLHHAAPRGLDWSWFLVIDRMPDLGARDRAISAPAQAAAVDIAGRKSCIV